MSAFIPQNVILLFYLTVTVAFITELKKITEIKKILGQFVGVLLLENTVSALISDHFILSRHSVSS